MIHQITIQSHAEPKRYSIRVILSQHSTSETLVLWLGNGYFFPVYNATTTSYFVEINTATQSWNINTPMTIRAMLYDFDHEKFSDVQEGQVVLSHVAGTQHMNSTTKTVSDASVWRLQDLWVADVEGPFQDGVLVTEIDLSKPAYYLATPSKPTVTDTQILSIRWLYQYDNSTPASFNNSSRSVVTDKGVKKCKLECSFHNRTDISSVTVYPFFKEMSASRMKKVPVKNQNNTGSTETKWVNPLSNSQRTYFNFSGVRKEQNGAFGPVRTNANGTPKNHQGLDLFAEVGTPCYACLDGEIVRYANEGNTGYGNVLVLKVKGEDLRKAKRNYTLEFQKEVESGPSFNLNASFLYLRYAHLKSAVITSGKVKAGDLIGHTGISGNAKGTSSPHLHFEVAMLPFGNGTGLQKRYNPAFFVRLNPIDVNAQTRVKKGGG